MVFLSLHFQDREPYSCSRALRRNESLSFIYRELTDYSHSLLKLTLTQAQAHKQTRKEELILFAKDFAYKIKIYSSPIKEKNNAFAHALKRLNKWIPQQEKERGKFDIMHVSPLVSHVITQYTLSSLTSGFEKRPGGPLRIWTSKNPFLIKGK